MTWTITNETTDSRGFHLQTTLFEGFKIEQLRSPRASSDAEFLPARVVFDGKEVWSFSKDHKNFGGMAFLREVGDELVIMVSTRHTLYEVVPVRDLSHRQIIGNEVVGGRKLKELVQLKELVAAAERLEPLWSPREAALRTALHKASVEARKAEKLAVDAAYERERALHYAKRDAKRAEITGRQRIFAYTLSGDRRHGYPVVGDEWLVLSAGAFCISVTSYDTKNGEIGELIESFAVKVDGARKARHAVATVTKENTSVKKVSQQNISFVTVPVKGELEEVILASDMDSIRRLRDQGLNSGTLVMCPKAGDDDRYSVFSITAGKIEPVTEVMRKK